MVAAAAAAVVTVVMAVAAAVVVTVVMVVVEVVGGGGDGSVDVSGGGGGSGSAFLFLFFLFFEARVFSTQNTSCLIENCHAEWQHQAPTSSTGSVTAVLLRTRQHRAAEWPPRTLPAQGGAIKRGVLL